MNTWVYIDGFNLYYGSLRKRAGTRWLDLKAVVLAHLNPVHQIGRIKFFTARITARSDPGAPLRQHLYLRALQLCPDMEIHYGHFLTKVVKMQESTPPGSPPRYVSVIKTEEKGSDVNLASHMLHDAHRNLFDCAIVVSGDSDLLAPVNIVKNEIGKRVGVLNPQKIPCKVLQREATFYKHLKPGKIRANQFPPTLTDSKGTFKCPPEWL